MNLWASRSVAVIMRTIQKLFLFGAFVSVLFIHHPEFHRDLATWIQSSTPGTPNFSVIFAIACLIIFVARKRKSPQKPAGGIGLRLHAVKEMGWLVIEVCLR